jgi:hypothetical protein
MTTATPYGISTSIGSQSFQGYVNTPIGGPLNSSQYPCIIPYHSYGILTGQRPTPPQFFPGQEPVNTDMSITARAQYKRATSISPAQIALQRSLGKESPPITKTSYSSQRQYAVSSHFNYIEPIPGSMYTDILKSIAIGKSAYKVGLPLAAPIGTKNYETSFRRTHLQRARSGGCTAPKKKGSIYNYSLTQPGICAWGSAPRQNY